MLIQCNALLLCSKYLPITCQRLWYGITSSNKLRLRIEALQFKRNNILVVVSEMKKFTVKVVIIGDSK